jgi:hypothetical protein
MIFCCSLARVATWVILFAFVTDDIAVELG